jgi:hypothetical protein
MNLQFLAGLFLCGLLPIQRAAAQNVDPRLMNEALAVREELARSLKALRQYTWTESTEVLVKGKPKSSSNLQCRYDGFGELKKTPIAGAASAKDPNALSNRPVVRKKAEMEDYVERAVSMVHRYLPPKPDQIQYLLGHGGASLGQPGAGKGEIRFTGYLQEGDTLAFTYDSASKALLKINVASTLGSPKDPVTMEAIFETLPDGVSHLSAATLNAPAKKIQVKMRNVMYQKLSN